MKKFFLSLMGSLLSLSVYSQTYTVGSNVAYLFLLGTTVSVYDDGEFVANGFGGRIVKGTYDAETSKVTSLNYYEDDGLKTNGIVTVCNTYKYGGGTGAYYTSSTPSGRNKHTEVYYDKLNSNKDYTDICGDYSDYTSITFRDGEMHGRYYYYNHVHGGNCDYTEVERGSYLNNKKEGKWYTDKTMDCAGTLNTWFEWINGSYENTTVSTYADGVIVESYTYDR